MSIVRRMCVVSWLALALAASACGESRTSGGTGAADPANDAGSAGHSDSTEDGGTSGSSTGGSSGAGGAPVGGTDGAAGDAARAGGAGASVVAGASGMAGASGVAGAAGQGRGPAPVGSGDPSCASSLDREYCEFLHGNCPNNPTTVDDCISSWLAARCTETQRCEREVDAHHQCRLRGTQECVSSGAGTITGVDCRTEGSALWSCEGRQWDCSSSDGGICTCSLMLGPASGTCADKTWDCCGVDSTGSSCFCATDEYCASFFATPGWYSVASCPAT